MNIEEQKNESRFSDAAAKVSALPTIRLRVLAVEIGRGISMMFDIVPAGCRGTLRGGDLTTTSVRRAVRGLRDRNGRGLGGLTIDAAVDAALDAGKAVWAVRHARKLRNQRAAQRAFGSLLLPSGTPAGRLKHARLCAIGDAVGRVLRGYARQGAAIVEWVSDLATCGCVVEKEEGWVGYSRSEGSHYGITYARYAVSAMARCPVPRDAGGLLTLGAVRTTALGVTVPLYDAVWARQGVSGPVVERGFIALIAGRWYHASKIGGVKAEAKRVADDARWGHWQSAIAEQLRTHRLDACSVTVTAADAYRAGCCRPGVAAWIARHFGDEDPVTARHTVAEILRIDDQRDLVHAAAMSAIRRYLRTHHDVALPMAA